MIGAHACDNAFPSAGIACKDIGRNGQERVITLKAAYVLAYAHNAFASPETCV